MVKLSATLPKEHDENGLESRTRHVLDAYPRQDYLPVVGLVRTRDVLSDENFVKVPRVEFVHIELAIDADDDARARELLTDIHDARVAHIKQPLDLPDTDTPPAATSPLAIAAGVIDAEIVDDEVVPA